MENTYIIYNGELYRTDELYHYGILGMKWGVRRYQNADGSLTAAGRKRYGYDEVRTAKKELISTRKAYSKAYNKAYNRSAGALSPIKKHRQAAEDRWGKAIDAADKYNDAKSKYKDAKKQYKEAKKADRANETGLSDNQKKAIAIGAAVVATGLAAYGAYKVAGLYKGKGLPIDPKTGLRLLKNSIDADDITKINPGRIKFFSLAKKNKEIINGSSANCMLCTTTYELRKRGFDVRAGLSTTGYMPDDLFPKIFKNYEGVTELASPEFKKWFNDPDASMADFDKLPKWSTKDKLLTITDYVKNEGPGSRGNIMVYWPFGGGHSMIWENVDGKVIFKDGQTGEVYKDFAKDILKNTGNNTPIQMLRTDTLEFDMDGVKDFLNTDTVWKTYIDNGAEISARIATDPRTLATIGTTAYVGNRMAAVNGYKTQHPNTKLSDREILELLKRG